MYRPAAARLVIAQQTNDFVHYFVFGHDRPLLSSPKIRTGNSVTGRGVSACTCPPTPQTVFPSSPCPPQQIFGEDFKANPRRNSLILLVTPAGIA